ncbi:unnamed protein product [Paramecium primaurelia]|uniref:Uncharacterized protein n=1 Tax=Paramecium primaurelia TaxID=5886 RepID=A0A8S1PPY8_PARPR|nr:unnamed protein product [Paramecium primaurelia]
MDNTEQERRRIERKLKYKMPVTFRWGALLGLFGGIIHGGLSGGRTFYAFSHSVGGALVIGLGLCYHDFYLYARTYW